MQTQRALLWGVWTWVGNGAGCLLGMIPLALPISVVATLVTLFMGIGAMVLGVKDRRAALRAGDVDVARDARLGYWLGAVHIFAVASVMVLGYFVIEFKILGEVLGH